MNSLKNRIALITGAGSGIGKAIAILYASEGAKVVVSDIDEEGGQETTNLIRQTGGHAVFEKADTSVAEEHKNMVDKIIQQFGALHIAVNNAGISGPLNNVAGYPIDGWDRVISINLSGIFYGMHYQIPAIIASGGGSIVNMASILGRVGTKGSPAYVAAKHGVIGLTEAAALEYADAGIRINAIGPGYIRTPLLNILDDGTLNLLKGLHPMGRLGEPKEVAELALWLNSDKASFVTGSYYNIDGGYLAQ